MASAAACELPLLRAELCEDLVLTELLDPLVLPDDWRDVVAKRMEVPQKTEAFLESIAEEERRLTLLFQEGYIEEFAEFKHRWDKLQAERDAVRTPQQEEIFELGELLEAGAGDLWRVWENAADRKRMVKALFRTIHVDGEESTSPRIVRVEWQPGAEPLKSLVDL